MEYSKLVEQEKKVDLGEETLYRDRRIQDLYRVGFSLVKTVVVLHNNSIICCVLTPAYYKP